MIVIDTDLRDFLDQHVGWYWGYGAALACVGHLLSGCLAKIYLASSQARADCQPEGSHPDVDRNWSSEQLSFVHDAVDLTRLQKIGELLPHSIAMQLLRVCWENPGNAYNCGNCEKCLRTMIALEALGHGGKCPSFSDSINLRAVRRLSFGNEVVRGMHVENLNMLEQTGRSPALASALRKALQSKQVVRKMVRPVYLKLLNAWLLFQRTVLPQPRWPEQSQ